MKNNIKTVLLFFSFAVVFALLITGCAKNSNESGKDDSLPYSTTAPGNSLPDSVPDEGAILLLTLNSDKTMGTTSGGGIQRAGEPVTVTATANLGYIFKGWYYGETLIGNESAYTFNMPDMAYTLTARFAKAFTLTATTSDEAKGSVTGGGEYATGDMAKVTATANSGYSFVGWYNGDTLVSDVLTYTFTMPESDYALTANFEAVH